MVALETALIGALPDGSEVDGHDAGSGEMNIFISTDHPLQVFDSLKGSLVAHNLFADIRVAYREAAKDEYTILWPRGLRSFTVA